MIDLQCEGAGREQLAEIEALLERSRELGPARMFVRATRGRGWEIELHLGRGALATRVRMHGPHALELVEHALDLLGRARHHAARTDLSA